MKGLLCFLVLGNSLYVAESAYFSKQPPSVVKLKIGQNLTLRWNFTLAAGEKLLLMRIQYSKGSSFEISSLRIAYKLKNTLYIDPPFKGRVYVNRVGALTIGNVQVKDEGYYRCHIELTGGKPISSKVKVLVGALPVIKPFRKSDIALLQGDNFKTVCHVTGYPAPAVVWYRNSNNSEDKVVGSNGSLEIKDASLLDSGQYICHGRNRLGTVTKKIKIHVYERPQVSSFSHTGSLDGTIYECQEILFICEAFGNNPPVRHFHLYHDGKLIRNGSKSGQFKIKQVHQKDSGRYSCVPENDYGLGFNKSMDLKVIAAPRNCKRTMTPTEEIIEGDTTFTSVSTSNLRTVFNKIDSADTRSGSQTPTISLFSSFAIFSFLLGKQLLL